MLKTKILLKTFIIFSTIFVTNLLKSQEKDSLNLSEKVEDRVKPSIPTKHVKDNLLKGKITWYSQKGSGKFTASGHIFNENAMTTASNIHPFGTLLKVTNIRNGKYVIVKVTDRGAFSKFGVILDLTKGAFRQIEDLRHGVAHVVVEIIR